MARSAAKANTENIVSEAGFYRKVNIEKNAFRGVKEDAEQIGVVNVIVTYDHVAEEIVYEMAKLMAENLDALPKLNPLFKTTESLFEPLRTHGAAAFEFAGVPLHPGALRAYQEWGWLK